MHLFILQVVDKFNEIRQHSLKEFEDTSWEDKCACLLLDPIEMWSFNDPSTSNYIVSSQTILWLYSRIPTIDTER